MTIGDWRRPWVAEHVHRHTTSSKLTAWPVTLGSTRIGNVYVVQGFEYDGAGVIFGPDLVRRGNGWVSRPDESRDPAIARAAPGVADRLIRNTYKVLMTRGSRGTCLYSVDGETQDYLAAITS